MAVHKSSGSSASTTASKRKQRVVATRTTRLETRLTPEVKALLRRAAAIHGRSLSDFVVASAQEAAERAIRDHDVITLSVRDSQRFAEIVLNPPEPNEHLRAALRLYRSDVASDV